MVASGQQILDFEGIVDPSSDELSNSTAFVNNMTLPVHRWFRYSAGFSAAWAQQVIEESGAKRVLDPFAGSGTTVLAAESVGIESIGVDIHPFVSRVAQAKLLWRTSTEDVGRRVDVVVARAAEYEHVEIPDSALIEKCFDRASLTKLTRLRDAIRDTRTGDPVDELLWLGLVSILRVCSPVGTAQWQYVLPNKTKAKVAEPIAAFRARMAIFVEDMRVRQATVLAPPGSFFEEDAKKLASVPDGWADLVLTSPPYANNYDYADSARLEMSFLGEVAGWGDLKPLRDKLMKSCTQQMGRWNPTEALASPFLTPIEDDLRAVFESLDSTRREKAGNKAYHLMIAGYFYDSAHIFQALRRVCAPGSRMCYVVGDSAPYGIHVPVEEWLGRLALASGFHAWNFEQARTRNEKWKNRKHRVPLKEGRLWIEG